MTLQPSGTVAPSDFFSQVTDPAYVANPYPYLRRLRERAPAVPTPSGIWLVGRYADVAHAVRDPELSCDFASLDQPAEYFRSRGLDERFPMPLNALDPPDHRRIRSAVAPAFTSAMVQQLRPTVDDLTDQVLSRLADEDRPVDVVSEIAYPIPVAVIAGIFGIPERDRPLLEHWSRVFGSVSDPDVLVSEAERRATVSATHEAARYFGRLVVARRRAPGTDLMSRWVADHLERNAMSVPELLVNGVFLLIVGHHNTVSLISNGLAALLDNPGELRRLHDDPALIESGIDELLRYESPVQTATRFTKAPYDVDGAVIPAGRQVTLLLGSANRDDTMFPDADRLDLSRHNAGRHLAFGRGTHACVGGTLARMEAGRVLTALVRRFPAMRQVGPRERHTPSFALRAITRFPVRLAG